MLYAFIVVFMQGTILFAMFFMSAPFRAAMSFYMITMQTDPDTITGIGVSIKKIKRCLFNEFIFSLLSFRLIQQNDSKKSLKRHFEFH